MHEPTTIWSENDQESEIFLRFRKGFELSRVPSGASMLRITCSGLYRLYVNGQMLAHGPVFSGPQTRLYDEIDIAPALRAGKNVVAVWCAHFNYYTAQSAHTSPALACWLELPDQRICTDASWSVEPDTCFTKPYVRRNPILCIEEVYDGRKEENWQSAAYDDAHWPKAREIPMPWQRLEPRPIPLLQEIPVTLGGVFQTGEVRDQEFVPWMFGNTGIRSISISLLQDVVQPLRHTQVHALQPMEGGPRWRIEQPSYLDPGCSDQWCAVMIFDFGRELKGHPWFEVEGNENAVIDMACGEDMIGDRVQAVRQSTMYGDRYILREGRQSHETYDWKGFRYLQLTFRNLTRPLHVHGVGVTELRYPVTPVGRFVAQDPLLSSIWQTGAYTQLVCTNDKLMDCPWREQQQWLGDGCVQLQIFFNAFGNDSILRKFLWDFAQCQYDNGLFSGVSYGTLSGGGLPYADYSLWWVCGLHDFLTFAPDLDFAREMQPTLRKLLGYFESRLRSDGLLGTMEAPIFVDWAPLRKDGCSAALNAIFGLALKAGARIAEFVGEQTLADQWRGLAERIAAAFPAAFWDESRGLFADTERCADEKPSFSQHVQALAVLLGVDSSLSTPALGRAMQEPSITQVQPFFGYYLLEALAATGMEREALAFIHSKWGAMIGEGATTFWEEWQRHGTFRTGRWDARPRSYCHAWSAAPTAWLSRHHLGVHVQKPGGPLIFAPQPGNYTTAEGTVPSSHGPITVEWKIVNGEFHGKLKGVPAESPVQVKIPEPFTEQTFHLRADGVISLLQKPF